MLQVLKTTKSIVIRYFPTAWTVKKGLEAKQANNPVVAFMLALLQLYPFKKLYNPALNCAFLETL